MKVLMVIAKNGFRDEEYFHPKEIMENNGIQVTTACLEGGQAQSVAGKEVNIDTTVIDTINNVSDYDSVVFVGGAGMVQLTDNESLHNLARAFSKANKLVAAICVGPVILAKAGVLRDKQATVYPDVNFIESLENGLAKYVKEEVAEDDNIITADGPLSAYKFGSALVKKLS